MPSEHLPAGAGADGASVRAFFERTVLEESPDLHLVLLDDPSAVCLFAAGGRGQAAAWDPADVEGQSLIELVHPRDVPALQTALTSAREGAGASVVVRLLLPGRRERSCELEVRRPGRPLLVAVLRDVSAREQTLGGAGARAVGTDPATGLLTRPVFADRVQHALQRLDRTEALVALLFVDLDRFKSVNDTLGHSVGDRLLHEVSRRLTDALRPADTLARIGGDEFAVLLEDLRSTDEAWQLATRIAEIGRVPVAVHGHELRCTMSVGVAVTADAQHGVEQLLDEADLAMYRAKECGRDRAVLFDDGLRLRSLTRLSIERLLRRALQESLLRIEFQPLVGVPDGELVCVEALLRIQQGEDDRLLPSDFLDVAAACGLLPELDLWVLEAALRQAARWCALRQGAAPLPVSLNLSERELSSSAFGAQVLERLAAHGLAPGLLHLEVREEVLHGASPAVLQSISVLRDAGVRFGIDDYGTGASSFARLATYPVDYVKIDRSVVCELAASPVARALAGAVVEVAHALGLVVVGEGVESPEQRAVLAEIGCDQAQGWLWGPSTDAVGLLPLVCTAGGVAELSRGVQVSGTGRTRRTAHPDDGARMTTDSGDSTPVSGEHHHGSGPEGTSSDMKSPYDIGLLSDEEETGPKPVDPELEEQQIRGEA